MLSNPAGVQISAPSTLLVTIADDDVRATKTAAGRLEQGQSVVYTITLSRPGSGVPGTPWVVLYDTVPEEMSPTAATATSGIVSMAGNEATWRGDIGPLGTVTVTLEESIDPGTGGMLLSNQGTVHFNRTGEGDGAVDTEGLTDDPDEPGDADPTVFQVGPGPVSFYTLPPCRLVDTRNAAGPLGGPALVAQIDRTFTLRGACGIPDTAKALAMNLTVTGATKAGNLRLHAPGLRGKTETLQYAAGTTLANNAVMTLDTEGRLAVFCDQPAGGTVHFILDVNGYFE